MKKRSLFIAMSFVALFFATACDDDETNDGRITVTETFESGADGSGTNGWEAVFGSYPEG